MVDWRESGIQIIASLIGSGLVAGLITGIITEINKPHIDISVQGYDYSLNIPQGTFINTFTNTGNSPASNVRLTMYYPEYKINDTTLEYSSENVSLNFSNEHPSILSVSIPRFTNGAIITINTITNFPYSKDIGYNPPNKTAIPFSIIATYDEGSDKYNTEDKTYNIFFIYAIIAIAAFAIALKYKKISELIGNNINKTNQSKFVFQVYQDILAVKNIFIHDQQSVKYISTEKWKSSSSEFKFQIFNSFDDYSKVEKFYRELETRNIKISETDISINQVLNSNRECLKFANISLTEINWRKYDLKKVYVDRMLALPWIILGSLFILYVCESIPFYFLHNYEFNRTDIQPSNILIYGIPLNVLSLGITYIITISIVIIIRSLSSMLIVRQIEKMSLSEHNNIVYDKDQLGEIFGAYKKKKLFLISLLITGIPTIIIMSQIQEIISTLNNEFSNYSYDLLNVYQITNPLTSYPLTYILLDIGRMTILVWIITKFYSKRLKKIIP